MEWDSELVEGLKKKVKKKFFGGVLMYNLREIKVVNYREKKLYDVRYLYSEHKKKCEKAIFQKLNELKKMKMSDKKLREMVSMFEMAVRFVEEYRVNKFKDVMKFKEVLKEKLLDCTLNEDCKEYMNEWLSFLRRLKRC